MDRADDLAPPPPAGPLLAVRRWFGARADERDLSGPDGDRIDFVRVSPFLLMHVVALAGPFVVGASPVAVGTAVALYLVRMFAITGFYHRYFSHRTFRMGRAMQLVAALLGSSAVQRGPLWWAAHHRNHHRDSDGPTDVHSPRQLGFWRSHVTWFLTRRNFKTHLDRVPDLARFPELRWLDRFDIAVPVALAVSLALSGALLRRFAPSLGTNGPQMLVWGFFVSTIVLFHATGSINSLSHRWGRQRFATGDDSRNNPWLAAITLGEGWHNNHHHHPGSVRQGFFWWEYDPTWWGLALLERLGLVHDLRPIPSAVVDEARRLDRAS